MPFVAPAGPCEICRSWAARRICDTCIARFAAPALRCRGCALRLPGGDGRCGDCLREPAPFERAVCAVDYSFPWDRLIIDLKFHGLVELALPLSERLTGAAREAGHVQPVDLVLPVPLSRQRLAERGFNQAWEIARRVADALTLPARHDLLLRPLDAAHQADLPREQRARNLRGAFMVTPAGRAALQGRRVALVDDVLTTGATAREATIALLRGGAAAVQVWTVARTA